jgi:ribonuclease HI
VAGHSGHAENEECDRMAVEAYKELQRNNRG